MTAEGLTRKQNSMPCRHGSQLSGVRQMIAAPDHVQIGAQQQEIVTIDVARACIGDIEHSERRTIACKGPGQQRAGVRLQPGGIA